MFKERNIFTLILLSIVTFGIYGIYFWYKYAEDMNKVCDGDGQFTQNYIIVLLLSIVTCGVYTFIWYYGIGNRLQANAPRYGLNFQENGTSVLIWMVFGSLLCGFGNLFAMHILIKNMNALERLYYSDSDISRQQY